MSDEATTKEWSISGADMRTAGKYFTHGVFDALFWPVMIIVAVTIALNYFVPFDDCDDYQGRRCNMRVYTDNKTGLQYLATQNGALTPRMTLDGSQARVYPSPASEE